LPWSTGAAAHAVLDIFEEENLLEKAVALGDTLTARFNKWKDEQAIVTEVRGLGAMRGLALTNKDGTPAADKARQMVSYCFDRGLNTLACGIHGNIIRVLMPLNIEKELLEKGLDIMEAGLSELSY